MASRTIKYVPLDDIIEADVNPKLHDLPAIDRSIDRLGFGEPPLVDERTGRLVAGHGRIEALRARRGREEPPPDGVRVTKGVWLIPVVYGWSSLDDAHAAAYLVASNQLTMTSGWDTDLMGELLAPLDEDIIGIVGITDDVLHDLFDDAPPTPWTERKFRPLPDAAGHKSGDVYDIGPHRVIIGDASDPAVWGLVPAAGLVVTDPPYGIGYTGGGVERELIDDDDTPEIASVLLGAVLDLAAEKVVPGAACYTFGPSGVAMVAFVNVLYPRGLLRWTLVWVKNNATLGRADYHPRHEMIWYGWFSGGPRAVPVADRTKTTVLEYDRPSTSKEHPTMKPVDLLSELILNSSHVDDIVLDPFAGSGSTGVAAALCGRRAVLIEKEPAYGKVCVDRMVEACGLDAVKVSPDLHPPA